VLVLTDADLRLLLRLGAFVPLALFGLVQWAALVHPAATGRAWVTVVAGVGAALVLLGLGSVGDRRVRVAAGAALVLALVLVGVREAGVPATLLWPGHWGELRTGVSQGVDGMPSVTVPYRGSDAWIRIAILGGGTLLAGLAALLAFWPRRGRQAGWPAAAAVVLSALYAIPVVEAGPERPFLGGAVFAVLLALFLWLERLRAEHVGAAGVILALATVVGLIAAPLLDAQRPWLDYQGLAEDLQPRAADTFDWDHRYTPLDWPRDGREVLRVKAPISTYWKATSLGVFDGVRWRQGRTGFLRQDETEAARLHPEWLQTMTVTLRNMESRDFITAGSALRILAPAPDAVRSDSDTFVTRAGSLKRGQTYRAQVYSPKPSPIDLQNAGDVYPDFALRHYLRMQLPQSVVRVPIHDIGSIKQFPDQELTLGFAAFGEQPAPVAVTYGSGAPDQQGAYYLRRSGYARVWRLAQSLRAASASPEQYVQKVLQRVQQNATYNESPAQHRLPLASFLFGDRQGYCQQFSGAMALLLRMGGVPARVASGFTPGRYDRRRKEYVVRDLDAHSWVEAYFPGLGWVTFDPTPAASPASSQSEDPANVPVPSLGQVTPNGDRAADPGNPGAQAADQGGSGTTVLLAVALLLAGGLVAAAWTVVRRGRLPGPPLSPELFDLQRALHRSGRTPPARTTLRRLEETLGGTPAAREYLRALRSERYGGAGGGPTDAQRRALREELAAGLGVRGRVRALWALPPRLRRGRRAAP
jgi:transglutaminase-like putative cysteine protease